VPVGGYEQRPGVTSRQRQQEVILQATQTHFLVVGKYLWQKPTGVMPALPP